MEHSTEVEDDGRKPKYDFQHGSGVRLGDLSRWVTSNSKAGKELEAALEPLHRLLYGRAGKTGERRAALCDFRGLDPIHKEDVAAKVSTWKKEAMATMIKTLGIPLHLSVPKPEQVSQLAEYLMAPTEGKSSVAKPKAASKRPSKGGSAPRAKRPRDERSDAGPGTGGEPPAEAAQSPPKRVPRKEEAPRAPPPSVSDDAVRVAVYKRVLQLTRSDRATLGVKALRTDIEMQFGLVEGALKDRKNVIAETASECCKALLIAESSSTAPAPPGDVAASAEVQVAAPEVAEGGPAAPDGGQESLGGSDAMATAPHAS